MVDLGEWGELREVELEPEDVMFLDALSGKLKALEPQKRQDLQKMLWPENERIQNTGLNWINHVIEGVGAVASVLKANMKPEIIEYIKMVKAGKMGKGRLQ